MGERVYDYFGAKQFKRIVNLDLYQFIILKPLSLARSSYTSPCCESLGAENSK